MAPSTTTTTSNCWTAEWIDGTAQLSQTITPARSGHVAFTLKDQLYIFGGYAEESPDHRYATNDLWKFEMDSDKPRWESVWEHHQEEDDKSSILQERLAAAAASSVQDNKAFVFGGWDPQQVGTGGVILKDIQEFCIPKDAKDNDKPKCTQLETDLGDATSRLVAVTMKDDCIVLHNHRCTESIMIFNPQTQRLSTQATTGPAPSPRGLHAAVRLSPDQLLVFGGAAQDGNMSNQVFLLNCQTWEWKELKCGGGTNMPSPRASPCLCTLDERTAILFGGAERTEEGGLRGCDDLWLLSLVDCSDQGDQSVVEWKPLDTAIRPPGRNAATLSKLPRPPPQFLQQVEETEEFSQEEHCQYFLLTGGWYPFQKTYGDAFVLKVSPVE